MDTPQTRQAVKPPYGCGRCDNRWGGLNTAHCGARNCHQTFTGIVAFDKHRAGSHAAGTRHCVDPATLRDKHGQPVLVDAGRGYPCWGLPSDDERWLGTDA